MKNNYLCSYAFYLLKCNHTIIINRNYPKYYKFYYLFKLKIILNILTSIKHIYYHISSYLKLIL